MITIIIDHPSKDVTRALTLVAKVIQNLGNMAEFGGKEPFMANANQFLTQHKSEMTQYIDQLAVWKPFSANNNHHPYDTIHSLNRPFCSSRRSHCPIQIPAKAKRN